MASINICSPLWCTITAEYNIIVNPVCTQEKLNLGAIDTIIILVGRIDAADIMGVYYIFSQLIRCIVFTSY